MVTPRENTNMEYILKKLDNSCKIEDYRLYSGQFVTEIRKRFTDEELIKMCKEKAQEG